MFRWLYLDMFAINVDCWCKKDDGRIMGYEVYILCLGIEGVRDN
jgi:hypothetical protein